MVGPNPNLNQPGIDQFLGALHSIGVKSEDLSAQAVKNKFNRARAKPAQEKEANKPATPKAPGPEAKDTGSPKKADKQEGRGIKRKSTTPPGIRPKILYVY